MKLQCHVWCTQDLARELVFDDVRYRLKAAPQKRRDILANSSSCLIFHIFPEHGSTYASKASVRSAVTPLIRESVQDSCAVARRHVQEPGD